MSSTSSDRTGTTRQRNSHAQYWTFFSKEAWRFWHFLARRREDLQTPPSPPQHQETAGATGAPDTTTHSTAKGVNTSPKSGS
jgi:hypothetical protein